MSANIIQLLKLFLNLDQIRRIEKMIKEFKDGIELIRGEYNEN